MPENIWRIDVDALDEDRTVRPLFERIADAPGFEPARYDLNKKEQWRSFVLDRAVVDALTQRTQLVRIEGQTDGTMAMVAMGKHGEEPTAVLQIGDGVSPPAIVEHWERLFGSLAIRNLRLDSKPWRDALGALELRWPEGDIDPVQVAGWSDETVPADLEKLESGAERSGPVRVERRDRGVYLWLGPKGRVEGAEHREQLERAAELLRG